VKVDLAERLAEYTRQTGDPRALGQESLWDHYPYYGIRINKDWSVQKAATRKE
jgi:hypothetical protein